MDSWYISQTTPLIASITGNGIFGLRCKYKKSASGSSSQFFMGMYSDLLDRLNGYGVFIDDTASHQLKLMDDTSGITDVSFSFTDNTFYYIEILYLTGNAIEIRAWNASSSRPSSATLSQAARSRTAAGTKLIVSFNTGSANRTFTIDDIHLSAGSNAVVPTTPSTGFLENTGEPVSRSTYSSLFAVVGTTYGSGDGSTTFNLPKDWPSRLNPTVIKT